MSSFSELFKQLAHEGEQSFDFLKNRLVKRLGWQEDLNIQTYNGYGTADHITMRGRILANALRGEDVSDDDSLWENLLNTYRQIESDEKPGIRVTARTATETVTAISNEEGFFQIELPPAVDTSDEFWQPIELEADDLAHKRVVSAKGQALIPSRDAAFGIISDIDDTVLQSSATNYLKAARLMFLNNYRTRLPFHGVAAFYEALRAGPQSGNGRNPIFYVSSSPWNLYNLLTDFFDFQHIPAGPLFLKDYGITAKQFLKSSHGRHKLTQIETILNTYPDLPFVLIGDSGQKDPEIYRDVVHAYPQRIKAIYIRDVTADDRDLEVLSYVREVGIFGVDLQLIEDSLTAANHAAEIGLISATALPSIQAAMEEVPPSDQVEKLLNL